MKKKYIFRLPDNWHGHLRQDDLLALVCKYFNIYGRVMCIGNTRPLIETADDAFCHRGKILSHKVLFEPVMCIMLTNDTTVKMIYEAHERGVKFVKFIPVGTSQGAVKGLRLDDYDKLFEIFAVIQKLGMHLLIHAELMLAKDGREIHLLDREEKAIGIIEIYCRNFPKMKITIEHASTRKMIEFVKAGDVRYRRATLTPQHALLTYKDVFGEKDWPPKNPYNYCLPVVKTKDDRQAVQEAMISGDPRFFAGTDAAPHWARDKEGENPPPGIFFGDKEYLLYFKIFKEMIADEDLMEKRFEDFTSRFGAEYYGYPLNQGTITIVREELKTPVEENGIRFCMGGETLDWKIVEINGSSINILT